MAATSHDRKNFSTDWQNLVRTSESEANYIIDELRGKSGVISVN